MAEYAGALIRSTKKLTVSGFCALAIGAGMLGGGTGIASADQIQDTGTVVASGGNEKTQGLVSAGGLGDVTATGGYGTAARTAAVSENCSGQLSGAHTCVNVRQAMGPDTAGGSTTEASQAIPRITAGSPAPGDLSACLYFVAGLQNDSAWNWVGHPGC